MLTVINDVTHKNIGAVREFLAQHADTCMFLSSNLAAHGPRLGDAINSGNFKVVEAGRTIQAVFCLTRRGILLCEAGGRVDFADAVIDSCRSELVPIRAVVGEWVTADALWQRVLALPNFVVRHHSRELLQTLSLPHTDTAAADISGVRRLVPDDFDDWEPLNRSELEEGGISLIDTLEQRRRAFSDSASGRRWGWPSDGPLLATVALGAVHLSVGQVGGVYTTPSMRRRGLARTLMHALIHDSSNVHRLNRLLLFTAENNHAAQALYSSLGFSPIGHFALLFGDYANGETGATHAS